MCGKKFVIDNSESKHLEFMKYLLLIIATAWCYSGIGAELTRGKQADNKKHLERVKERAVRHADHVKFVDSLVLSHSFSFKPVSFQREPAGSPRMIYNNIFRVGIYNNFIDLNLPFISGIAPPYSIVNLNYTLSSATYENYVAIQGDDSWTITFSSNLFSVNEYNFSLKIYSITSEAILTVSSDVLGTVTYNGTILAHY